MMGRMSQDTPPDVHAAGPGDEPGGRRPAGILHDRRVVPVAAALGAVALVVSLLSEWQLTTIDQTIFGDSEVGNRPLSSGVGDLGGWGAGYLVGVSALVVVVNLLIFGPGAGRAYARVAALALGGMQLAVLAGLVREMTRISFGLNRVFTLTVDDDQFTLTAGRGVYCAFAGVLTLMLAAWLAESVAGAAPAGGSAGHDSPWTESETRAEEFPDAPPGLTVAPSAPFQPVPGRTVPRN